MMAMFPIYLARSREGKINYDEYNSQIAQNEMNINQNFDLLYFKLIELEQRLESLIGAIGEDEQI